MGPFLSIFLSVYFSHFSLFNVPEIIRTSKCQDSIHLQQIKEEVTFNSKKNLKENELNQDSAIPLNNQKRPVKGTIPLRQVREAALNCAKNLWGENLSQGPQIPLYDLEGFLIAFEITYSIHHPFPSQQTILGQVKESRKLKEISALQNDICLFSEASAKMWGKSEFKTLIISVREGLPPVPEFSNGLSRYYTIQDIAKQKAQSILQRSVSLSKIYYDGFLDKYFEFGTEEEDKILINCFDLKAYSPEEVLVFRLPRNIRTNEKIRQMWREAKKGRLFSTLRTSKIEDYFDRQIRKEFIQYQQNSQYVSGVPFYDWSYSCGPTAAAMVLGYWDMNGYDRLVDYFFTRWDPRQEEYDTVPNVQEELALAMNTNVGKTGNYPGEIAPGIKYVTNDINGYEFNSYNSCNKENGCWNYIVREIDSGRPFCWGIIDFPEYRRNGHFATAIGYGESAYSKSKYVIVHNTWDTLEHNWVLDATPVGENYNNIITTVIPPLINSPPILGIQRDEEVIEVKEGKDLTFYFTFWDPDGDPIDFSISSLPLGAEITATRDPTPWDRLYYCEFDPWPSWPWEQGRRFLFTWAPDYTQAGNYIIHFELSDGINQHVEDVEIRIINYKKAKKRR